MHNILSISFFGDREYVRDIWDSVERLGYVMYDVPFVKLKNDGLTNSDIIAQTIDIITRYQIETVFMFLLPNIPGFIEDIKAGITTLAVTVPKFIFYNFDDPFSINVDLVNYSKGLDHFFTPNETSVVKLKNIMCRTISIHHLSRYIINNNINTTTNTTNTTNSPAYYDICILYDSTSDDMYDMKTIVRNIKLLAIDNDFTIKILGETSIDLRLETEYPDIYEGSYNIDDVVNKTRDSKMVFYIRGSILTNALRYDLLYELLAASTIIITPFTKATSNVLIDEFNCFLYDKDTYLETIHTCLTNYSNYDALKINAKNSVISFNIDRWCKHVLEI